ncbi:L-histidine N(alpha)-methyltransferase [Roseomonas sp. NAR14]|uniref:L-histidine N(Alpha)-methyltransferase n=1 Tax=Roseomonas acroporae TaxID=2937791 RepID=A0A9X2BXU7_9PROT|nr:L-histidine N(alpha)-methyltransferase [Roseomonas acroporae]MCK8786314.1 L-histidine N(alpha)-methyltransferase [Roseomonas acroporae]
MSLALDLAADRAGAPGGGQRAAFLADVLAGLSAARKTLPCKWLYDPEGAALFEAITRLPEYYPTRTETAILRERADAIAALAGPGAVVVEFGSGSAEKVGLLLRALDRPAAYVPVDIAPEWLDDAAARLAGAHAGLPVMPVVADFTRPFALPTRVPAGRRLGFFPGSTIGNFTPEEAVGFLGLARRVLAAGGGAGSGAGSGSGSGSGAKARLVLGADLVKAASVLEAAYDDAAGVTARFNLNLLSRINRELGGDLDPGGFRHRALWNTAAERVEMHLVSRRAQRATIAGHLFTFAEGETIHTESSHKYRPDRLARLAARAGWRIEAFWTDPDRLFSVSVLACDGDRAGPGEAR